VITADAMWFYSEDGCQEFDDCIPVTSNSAIHKGRNTLNTIEVKTHGQQFTFFVNGVRVGEVNGNSTVTEGSIGFVSGVYSANPDALGTHYYGSLDTSGDGKTETTFTNLTVARYG
jgi:hypothetical protein